MNAHALVPSDTLQPGAKVWLFGSLGSGKTLAAKLLARVVSDGLTAVCEVGDGDPMLSADDGLEDDHWSETEVEAADVLILDVWALHLRSDWIGYLESDKTVIVTSIDPPVLPAHIGDRLTVGAVSHGLDDAIHVTLDRPDDGATVRFAFTIEDAVDWLGIRQ